ncbi:MAG TPA: hypothetical protein PLA77_07505, partial [Bacteroidales bacterium]|nr:hypothetical protein [Bacteroidales bacterium]
IFNNAGIGFQPQCELGGGYLRLRGHNGDAQLQQYDTAESKHILVLSIDYKDTIKLVLMKYAIASFKKNH